MRRFLVILVLLALAFSLARYLLRLPSNEGRSESHSLAPDPETAMGRALLPEAAAHPGLSGILPLWPGIEAYAARMALARSAEQSIDARWLCCTNRVRDSSRESSVVA